MCAQKKNFCTICMNIFIFPNVWTFHCSSRLHTHLFATGPLCVPVTETGCESASRGQAACTVKGENLGGPSNASLDLLNVNETSDQTRVFHIGLIRGLSFSALGWAKIELSFYLHHKSSGPEV